MLLPLHDAVRTQVRRALEQLYGLAPADQPALVIDTPPNRALGDLALPVAFELARRLRKAPKAIALELAAALPALPGVSRVDATTGYLNLSLDRAPFIRARLSGEPQAASAGLSGKVIVEHTAINPNKAAHVGHVRNAVLGDTLARLLRFAGHRVEVQNYIDDTGVQVADVVVGFIEIEGRDLAAVQAIAADRSRPFDYYCWDLYAQVTAWYEADKSRLALRTATLHAIEAGGTPEAAMGAFIADRIVRRHLDTMARLNVDYDLLTWEGDILRLHFWVAAFDALKARGAVQLQTEGRLKGCWVMPIEAGPEGSESTDEEGENREKVIVRSDGTVTYVGKDIANQFWKFGLLGRDFHYRPFEVRDGRTLWATASTPGPPGPVPAFGHAQAVYNVIDSRQAYLQQLLRQALSAMGYTEQAAQSTHFAYEMVALSRATARTLGYVDLGDKPFVDVSGRKGQGVKADDLIDRLVATAEREVAARHGALGEDARRRLAETIATAALRYFMVKFSRGRVIAFDIEEALSFEGETGPYLQYAAVRAANILAKLVEREGLDEAAVAARVANLNPQPIETGEWADELWGLVLEAARLDELVDAAVRSLEPAVLAKYAFGLAQAFNAFYHRQPIVQEEHEATRLWRASAVIYVRRQLTRALDLMGCGVPERM
jgi:arginyl-tRNA synthetase